jgi:hypothetical protein
MNNEQKELLDEAYENYVKQFSTFESGIVKSIAGNNPMVNLLLNNNSSILSQEEFINKCKTDPEFSEKWGLKIVIKELSDEERQDIYEEKYMFTETIEEKGIDYKYKIPTKLITITYKDKTIESYE